MKKFIEELKRRNVIKATIAYLVVAWIVIQVALAVLPTFGASDWVIQAIIIVMAIGLPVWVIISWVYDITPQGIEKTAKDSEKQIIREATNKRLNAFIIVGLSIAVIVLTLKITNIFSSNSDKQYAIAILPFNNIQVDKGNEWLSKSFTESVNSNISKVSKLQVTDSYSSGKYKDSKKSNTEIAKELGVSYILRGTVTQLNNKLSITVELIDVISKKLVLSDSFEETFEENTLNIQQKISQQIVQKLKVKLTPQEDELLNEFPTKNMEAYKLFIRGSLINDSREKEDLEFNIRLNKEAIVLDSTFAEAYAEMAHSYLLLGTYGHIGGEEAENKSNTYAEKALQLNPKTFRAYAVIAMNLWSEDWDKAKEYHEKAIALNPNDAAAHLQYGRYFIKRPNPDKNKFLYYLSIGQQLNPLSGVVGGNFINALIDNDKLEEAEEYIKEMGFIWEKGDRLEKEGMIKSLINKDWTEAIRLYEFEIKKDPNNASLNKELAIAYDEILNDDINAIKYAQKAYVIDSTNSGNVSLYAGILIEGEKFAAANKLMQSKNYKKALNKRQQLDRLWYYYYHQEKYKKAQEVLKDSLAWGETIPYYTAQLLTHAQLGDRKYIEREFKEYVYYDKQKAYTYAVLKEKDSMYHYLGKMDDIKGPNSRREFDPYRKEERYKDLLRKHYLPITHWNE